MTAGGGDACPPGMVRVPASKFFMGSDENGAEPDEKPVHQVVLSAFCIDATEVTTAAYKTCSDRGDCRRASQSNEWPGMTEAERAAYDPLCNGRAPEDRAQHPVNCVTWEMADVFCRAVGKRLPTEAEWEHAARGSDGRRYPWGDAAPTATLVNACGAECATFSKRNHLASTHPLLEQDDGFSATAPVGSFPKGASPYGAVDMAGNVAEWVADGYASYAAGAVTDPKPAEGADRVVRGGAWNASRAAWLMPTHRFHVPGDTRSHGIGFRCAR